MPDEVPATPNRTVRRASTLSSQEDEEEETSSDEDETPVTPIPADMTNSISAEQAVASTLARDPNGGAMRRSNNQDLEGYAAAGPLSPASQASSASPGPQGLSSVAAAAGPVAPPHASPRMLGSDEEDSDTSSSDFDAVELPCLPESEGESTDQRGGQAR